MSFIDYRFRRMGEHRFQMILVDWDHTCRWFNRGHFPFTEARVRWRVDGLYRVLQAANK